MSKKRLGLKAVVSKIRVVTLVRKIRTVFVLRVLSVERITTTVDSSRNRRGDANYLINYVHMAYIDSMVVDMPLTVTLLKVNLCSKLISKKRKFLSCVCPSGTLP